MWKNKDEIQCGEIYPEKVYEVKRGKEACLDPRCLAIEELERKHDEFNLHRKFTTQSHEKLDGE